MTISKSDFTFVVRGSDGYLCNRFYHKAWTNSLIYAATFPTQKLAEEAAIQSKSEIVMVEIKEIMEFELEKQNT